MVKKMFFSLFLLVTSCNSQQLITSNDLLYQSTPKNLDSFGSFLWNKNKNDSIVFNNKNLKTIKTRKGQYYKSLAKYATFFIDSKYEIENITFSERSKILAYLTNFGEEISNNYKFSFMLNIVFNDNDLRYYNEFEKHNYYNLPGFKKEYRKIFKEFKPVKKKEIKPAKVIIKNTD